MSAKIAFNVPHMTGKELYYIAQAHFSGMLAGDGMFTRHCHEILKAATGSASVLLTHSCTAALEMQSLLLNIELGDEVIMPSFTFVSTANAVVLRGGVPVFVDIRPDTMNIDEKLIEDAIGPKTKAIAPVHYAGVACEMDTIMDIADRHSLYVVEDAAQGVMATYKGKALGSIGDLGALSFHETKNVIAGEGGALLSNNEKFIERAEILREKGTDRSRFFRGRVDKYTWQDIGSSYLPGELIAAFLLAQLEDAEKLALNRLESWNFYHELLAELEGEGLARRPFIPKECSHNAHLYYIILSQKTDRQKVLKFMHDHGIYALFHYVPLHSSPAGRRFCRTRGELNVTDDSSSRLIRLPLWQGIEKGQQEAVVKTLRQAITTN